MSFQPGHKRTIPLIAADLATFLLIVATVAIAYQTLGRKSVTGRRSEQVMRNWQVLASGTESIGPADAKVTIVVFSDFQCPWCAKMVPELHAALVAYPTDVRMVFRNFPLSIHAHAFDAAIAAACASLQGKFGPIHDSLFAAQREYGAVSWRVFANRAHVEDTAAFDRCIAQEATAPLVRSDMRLGNLIGIEGTPMVFVNGTPFRGADGGKLIDLVKVAVRGEPGP